MSCNLVRHHDFIALEDLNVRNMVKNHTLAKSISDAAWGQLRSFIEYKALRASTAVKRVEPAYSSQECCNCGTLNQVPLSIRVFRCRACRQELDRDFNAAWIVLKRGLAQVGQDRPELKPVEAGPMPPQTTEAACPVSEAETRRHETGLNCPRLRSWEDVTSCLSCPLATSPDSPPAVVASDACHCLDCS